MFFSKEEFQENKTLNIDDFRSVSGVLTHLEQRARDIQRGTNILSVGTLQIARKISYIFDRL